MKPSMLERLVLGSLWGSATRTLIALTALVLGATLVAAMLALSGDLRDRVGRVLRGYGANLVLVPRQGKMDQAALSALDRLPSRTVIVDWLPALVGVTSCSGERVVLVGVDFAPLRRVSPYLKIEGDWPASDGWIAVGWRLAQVLGVRQGADLKIGGQTLKVSGLVESGGDEDQQIFASLRVAQRILNAPGRISTVALSVSGGLPAAERVAGEIEATFPEVSAHVVRQIAASEADFLDRVMWLLGTLTACVLIIAGLCVMTTMFTQVTERRKEIGLMKALGASDRRIALLFVGEALVLGGLAGIIGCPLGVVLARKLGTSLFGAAIAVHLLVLPEVVICAVVLAVVAQILPLRRAVAIAPAATLRGE